MVAQAPRRSHNVTPKNPKGSVTRKDPEEYEAIPGRPVFASLSSSLGLISGAELRTVPGKPDDESIIITLGDKGLVDALKSSDLQIGSLVELLSSSMAKALHVNRAEHEHAAAIAELDRPVTPQTARALQTTENAYRRIKEEFGYLSSTEVAERLTAKSGNRQLANSLRTDGKLLGVRRTNRYLYPGFQFDARGQVKPVMEHLIGCAKDAGWSDDALLLWLNTPSSWFEDDSRPVEHLDDEELVVDALEQAANDKW